MSLSNKGNAGAPGTWKLSVPCTITEPERTGKGTRPQNIVESDTRATNGSLHYTNEFAHDSPSQRMADPLRASNTCQCGEPRETRSAQDPVVKHRRGWCTALCTGPTVHSLTAYLDRPARTIRVVKEATPETRIDVTLRKQPEDTMQQGNDRRSNTKSSGESYTTLSTMWAGCTRTLHPSSRAGRPRPAVAAPQLAPTTWTAP